MAVGLVGKKCGMTRVFTENGVSIPVTVIEVLPNRITQLKTDESDGYRAIQVTTGAKKASRVSKAMAGHYAKADVESGNVTREFRLAKDEMAEAKIGDSITAELFSEGQIVDVRGVTRGKGFAGGVKRHGFRMQPASHGNSLSHRALGSTGMCQTPGRVLKGKKMPGQMGNVNRCVQNQEVVRVDNERNLILIRGAVPGAPGASVVITPAIKKRGDK